MPRKPLPGWRNPHDDQHTQLADIFNESSPGKEQANGSNMPV